MCVGWPPEILLDSGKTRCTLPEKPADETSQRKTQVYGDSRKDVHTWRLQAKQTETSTRISAAASVALFVDFCRLKPRAEIFGFYLFCRSQIRMSRTRLSVKTTILYFFCERNWKMALEAKSHSLFCSPASHSDNAEIKSSFLSYVKIEGEISGIRENINEFSGKEWEVAQNVHTVVALYLSPWVSSVRCDENTDVSAGQLGSDHTWIQKGSEGAFKHVIAIQTWNRCAGKVDFISLCKLLLAGKDRSKDQIWLGALRDAIEDKQQYGCANQSANQIISSPDAIIIPGADSLLTMFPEV